jgi:hypothetical protein
MPRSGERRAHGSHRPEAVPRQSSPLTLKQRGVRSARICQHRRISATVDTTTGTMVSARETDDGTTETVGSPSASDCRQGARLPCPGTAYPAPAAHGQKAVGGCGADRAGVAAHCGPGGRAGPDVVPGTQPQPGVRRPPRRRVLHLGGDLHRRRRLRHQQRRRQDSHRVVERYPLVRRAQPQPRLRRRPLWRVLHLGGNLHRRR